MRFFKPFTKVEVTWLDSVGSHSWRLLSEHKFGQDEDLIHRSMGYVVHQNDKAITLAQSMQQMVYSDSDRVVMNTVTVPVVAVKKVTILK